MDGYTRALKEKGIKFSEDLVFNANPSRVGGYEAMNALLGSRQSIRAAVCYNDIAAFGALSALGEKGLRAGSDFALMGFDNIVDTAHSNPPLSTVDIHPTMLGEQAASILLKRIQEPDSKRLLYMAEPALLLRQTA